MSISRVLSPHGPLMVSLCATSKVFQIAATIQNPTSVASTLTRFFTNTTGSIALAILPTSLSSFKMPFEAKILLKGTIYGLNAAHLISLSSQLAHDYQNNSISETALALNATACALSLFSNIHNLAMFKHFLKSDEKAPICSIV